MSVYRWRCLFCYRVYASRDDAVECCASVEVFTACSECEEDEENCTCER
jgi:hypothetical protein